MLGRIVCYLAQIFGHSGSSEVCADKVRRTFLCAPFVIAADVAVLFPFVVLIPLLVKDAPAVGAEQYAGEQAHLVLPVRAFALFPKFLHTLPCFSVKYRLMRVLKHHLFFFGIVHA